MARRRRMTAARRRQIQLAQLASARKRKMRAKDGLGYWVAKGVRKVASTATMGASSALTEFMEGVQVHKRRKAEAKAKALRKRRKGR